MLDQKALALLLLLSGRTRREIIGFTCTLVILCSRTDCIIWCIGASSTDNFPEESVENTLEPIDHVEMRPSYWSSGGQRDPCSPECLVYMLYSDLCLVDEIKIQPFKAFFQYGDPIYSAQYVRFRMGYPKLPLCPEQLVSDENEGQLAADDNYTWTYTSPEFPMVMKMFRNRLSFCTLFYALVGWWRLSFSGGFRNMDGLYYICVSHIQILGNPLSQELSVAPCENGLVLKYHPEPRRSNGLHPLKWRNFATRIWQSGTRRGSQALLSRLLFGPLLQLVEDEGEAA